MVTNKEYEIALKDLDNRKIMTKVCTRFKESLSTEDLRRCRLIGLWKALRFWKPKKGGKFTSFLYQSVYWECAQALKNEQKDDQVYVSTCSTKVYDPTPVFEVLDGLPCDLQDIVHKRYIDRMTLQEIGSIYGCSYETIRKKIKKAIKILKSGV